MEVLLRRVQAAARVGSWPQTVISSLASPAPKAVTVAVCGAEGARRGRPISPISPWGTRVRPQHLPLCQVLALRLPHVTSKYLLLASMVDTYLVGAGMGTKYPQNPQDLVYIDMVKGRSTRPAPAPAPSPSPNPNLNPSPTPDPNPNQGGGGHARLVRSAVGASGAGRYLCVGVQHTHADAHVGWLGRHLRQQWDELARR